MRRLLLIGLAVLVVAGAGAGIALALGGSGSAAGRAAARRLLAGALADARARGSFHYVSRSTSTLGPDTQTQVTVGDAGATQGSQDISVNGDHFTVLVIGPATYFQGDAVAMVTNLGIPGPVAQAHARQWISLASGDTPYPSVTAAVTTSSALADNVTFRPTSVLPLAEVDGRTVQGIRGPMGPLGGHAAHGTATLYVTTGRRPVPVSYVEHGTVGTGSSKGSVDFSIIFSAWGQPVAVPAPPGPIAFSALGVSGAPSPGPTLFT